MHGGVLERPQQLQKILCGAVYTPLHCDLLPCVNHGHSLHNLIGSAFNEGAGETASLKLYISNPPHLKINTSPLESNAFTLVNVFFLNNVNV